MASSQDERSLRKLMKKTSLKRKLISGNSKPTKRQKVLKEEHKLDELDWKVVERPSAAGIDEDGGILTLEEVENVEVYYEETLKGRVAKFRQIIKPARSADRGEEEKERTEDHSKTPDDEMESSSQHTDTQEEVDHAPELPEWDGFGLAPPVLHRLHDQGFTCPTPIQRKTLPLSLSGRDVIGVSQTGSGKTLAFALPILHHILSQPFCKSSKGYRRELKALIITPTRELALQVAAHINACAPLRTEKQTNAHAPPRVSLATIVGGMSSQKQMRMLERGADIIVATPGRFWELLSDNDDLATQMAGLRFLVLDEADRMIENGHFAELDKIIRLTLRPEFMEASPEPEDTTNDKKISRDNMQTFVFSATMNKDLQRNLKRFKSSKSKTANETTIDDLLSRLDFRDSDPAVVDLSPKDRLVSTFQESKVECLMTDKDSYLYYFLLRYSGRSLVFMSSIDGIRRLTPILELLDLKVWPLHSQMEQKQRLKNLERFKNSTKCVLLATDVAARGLDVPFVDHVIHFQIPRSADIYVHRNGRTARADRPGFGLLLCAPDERKLLRALFKNLNRKDDEVMDLPVERDLLDKLKTRVEIAREIDKIQHGTTKENHDKNWLKITAEALEIDLSDEEITGKSDKERDRRVKNLKGQLSVLLSQPLMARGISAKFITSGSRPIVDDLLRGENHNSLLGLKVIAAQDDILTKGKNTKGKRIAIIAK